MLPTGVAAAGALMFLFVQVRDDSESWSERAISGAAAGHDKPLSSENVAEGSRLRLAWGTNGKNGCHKRGGPSFIGAEGYGTDTSHEPTAKGKRTAVREVDGPGGPTKTVTTGHCWRRCKGPMLEARQDRHTAAEQARSVAERKEEGI
jgi:hypothetical protein